jgi:hypothetical protein
MNSSTPSIPSFYLDGKPLPESTSSTWQTFEEICTIYSNHLHEKGRAILAVRLDGIEIDCSTPPSESSLREAKKIEVESCLFEDLLLITLNCEIKKARELSNEVLELSTDCLILTPQETFVQWKEALETVKSLIGFVPKMFSMQPFATPLPEVSEEYLTKHIHEIQEVVEICRKAWDIQDVVVFSDTLEIRIVSWLKSHVTIAEKLKNNISIQVK